MVSDVDDHRDPTYCDHGLKLASFIIIIIRKGGMWKVANLCDTDRQLESTVRVLEDCTYPRAALNLSFVSSENAIVYASVVIKSSRQSV